MTSTQPATVAGALALSVDPQALWWGTYPATGLGTPVGLGEGVWRSDGGEAPVQVLELPSPSFLVAHPTVPVIYAITESDPCLIHVIDVSDPGAPSVTSSLTTGGASGCHLLLAPDARTLYASHYMSGDVAVVPLTADGSFAVTSPAQLLGHTGSGPRADRQEAPHAHSAGYAPGGRQVLVADLGTDELRKYAVAHDGLLADAGIAATLPPGAGPRHFAVRGNLIYVVCELDNQLRTLRWDDSSATAEVIAQVASTQAPHRTGDEVNDGHLVIVGDVLLVSVRGADVISIFDLSPEGEARYRNCFDAGFWPRYFAAIAGDVWVGAERGHEVRRYALDDVLALGPQSAVAQVADVAYVSYPVVSPACVVATPASAPLS